MKSTSKAVAGFLLATALARAQHPMVTPAPACGGDNPCAAQVSAVPTCATSCIESVASDLGCVHGDYSCHCAKSQAIQETGISCVLDACGLDALNVIPAVDSLCSCVTASPTSPCTSEPRPTTTSQPPVITDAPTCGGNPCSDFVSAVPTCATSCIESAASVVGCAQGDYNCQCASSTAIQATAINCVLNGCGNEALNVIGAVDSMCSCVTANPTTPCPESTTTSTVDITTTATSSVQVTTTTSTAKPTPTPACPGTECSFPNPAEHECVAGCIDAVLPEFGCNELEDWNCYCNNFRKISSRAFQCAWACSTELYNAFNTPASKGCTCLLQQCPVSSSSTIISSSSPSSSSPSTSSSSTQSTSTTSTSERPTSTSTSASSTITSAPECAHPCAAYISAVPDCATGCITSVASNVGCGSGDYNCRCSSSSAIQNSAVNCVIGACGLTDALKVVDAVGSLCSCVTASPTTPCGSTTSSKSIPSTATTTEPSTTTSSSATSTATQPQTSTITTTFPPTTSTCPHPCDASVSAVPICGTACITSAASAVGCRDTADLTCRCASSSAIQATAINCVIGACGITEALKVADAVGAVCKCVSSETATGTGCGSYTTSVASSSMGSSSSGGVTGTGTKTGTGTGSLPLTSTSTTSISTHTGQGSSSTSSSGGSGATSTSTRQGGSGGEETTPPCPSSSKFVNETRTVEVTTSVCDDDDNDTRTGSSTRPPAASCTSGCGGSGGASGNGEGGGSGSGGDSGTGQSGGGSGGGGGGGGSVSKTTPTKTFSGGSTGSTATVKPPVATAGASSILVVGTGCLAGVIAAFVAFL